MKELMPEIHIKTRNEERDAIIDKTEAHIDGISLLEEAAASWTTCNPHEINIGLEKIKTARSLFAYCDALQDMQWIIYAVEMQLFRTIRELCEEEAKKKRNTGGNVYFLQSRETGLIKIGFSKQPKSRTKNLMVSHHEEIEPIGFIPGSQRTESSIHKAFSKTHKRGEWFYPSIELLGFIKGFSSPLPLAGSAKQIEARA